MTDETTLTYDPEAKALYMRFSDEQIEETLEFSSSVYLDVDQAGRPVGLEVLNVAPEMVSGVGSSTATLLADFLKKTAA